MAIDDLDDLLNPHAELEARFRELEGTADIEELKRKVAAGEADQPKARTGKTSSGKRKRKSKSKSKSKQPKTADPLAAMKAKVEGKAGASSGSSELYLLVLCPECDAKNRTSLTRLRNDLPSCGRCKAELSFTR